MPIINLVYEGHYEWKPNANTLAYFPFQSDGLDKTGNYTLSNTGTQQTIGRLFTSDSELSSSLDGTGVKTMMAWCKFGLVGGNSNKSSILRGLCYNYNFQISQTNDSNCPAFFMWRNAAYYAGIGVVTAGNWYLITLTKDTSLKGYINTSEYTLPYTGDINIASDTKKLIMRESGTLNAILSEVIIENRTRTAEEISNYYNQTKGNYGL